jgi:DNA-binding response OmpR family regulator
MNSAPASLNAPIPRHIAGLSENSSGVARERILIVDDSVTVRFSFMVHLSKKYECDEAKTVQEAFEKLKQKEYSLVISDVIMPGLSGVELLRRVVDSYPDTAVIMVTGVDRPQRALDAVRLGAYDYLIKPCEVDVVELAVERALERRRLLIDGRRYRRDLEARNAELTRGKSELQRLQAQIVHSEKMASLGQLSAGIAHEINNPIGFVYSNIEILNDSLQSVIRLLEFYDKADLPSDIAEQAASLKAEIDYEATLGDLPAIIADCREGAERVRNIVQNLRTFSRLDEAEF